MKSEGYSIVDLRRMLLKDFGWLADLYMIDFFVENHWNRLPSSWREAFENLKPCDWWAILNSAQQPNTLTHVLPLSFICFRFSIEMVSLRRREIDGLKQFAEVCRIENHDLPDYFPSFEESNDLRIKVKSKKRHEIERVVHAIEILRRATSPSFDEVLDIGAGIGHLSRQIAFRFGCSSNPLRVATIEADEELVRKSAKLDFMLTQRRLSRRKDKAENNEDVSIEMPERNALFVEPGKELNGIGHEAGNTTKCVIGVHTCGDLAVSIIKEFVADPTARVLLHFGCCYHKLNGGQDKRFIQCCSDEPSSTGMIPNGKGVGFPLSDTYANFSLSYAKRELSCHAIEIFQWRLLDEHSVNDFRMQCFRSVLEWLIVKASRRKDQSILERNIRHMRLRHVKARHLGCFWDYFKAVLNDKKQLFEHINAMLEEDPLVRMEVDGMISQWHRVLAVYTIRLIIAKLTETVILEDRRCYLTERGYNAHLVALFDPRLSARNIALICIK